MSKQQGFTLIELMIVIAIITILSAIAIPTYSRYVQRARRTDAHSALLNAQLCMERCFGDKNTYAGCQRDNDGECSLRPTDNTLSPDGDYQITVRIQNNGTSFILTATPVSADNGGRQAGDADCATITLDSTGTQGATGDATNPARDCWQ